MFETYGHHDMNGSLPQPEPRLFWPGPDVEHHTTAMPSPLVLGQTGGAWDPAEELAYLLQDSMAPRPAESFDRPGFDETTETLGSATMFAGPPSVVGLPQAQAPTQAPAQSSGGHRHAAAKSPFSSLLRTGSLFTAVLVAVIAAVVSVFSGLAICDALRHSAAPRTAHDVVSWWPLLIYGPWMVASLSILRAALHQRRAVHSWSIVLLFSTLATFLCVAQAPRTLAAQAAATLPAIAALACFQQLVRQITLTRPPRNPVPRHRNRMPASPGPSFHYGA
ncbi:MULTISPECIES: hypothetical protein [unclassified Streptomyces]|uniref:hypothetical protein n=1 Tax=unclassified Streptomyces TaxID=2593676 RepID=UPI0036ADB5A0